VIQGSSRGAYGHYWGPWKFFDFKWSKEQKNLN